LWRWPLLAAACLPWFLAAGYAQWGASAGQRVLWWARPERHARRRLYITLLLAPSMAFLVLLMPLLRCCWVSFPSPRVAFDRPGPYAIGTALFFGWVLAASSRWRNNDGGAQNTTATDALRLAAARVGYTQVSAPCDAR